MLTERDSLHIPTMKQAEDARRIARYAEAKEIIEQFVARGCALDVMLRANKFISDEPTEVEGGR